MTQEQAVKLWNYLVQTPFFEVWLDLNGVPRKMDVDKYGPHKYYKSDITTISAYLRQWADALEGK